LRPQLREGGAIDAQIITSRIEFEQKIHILKADYAGVLATLKFKHAYQLSAKESQHSGGQFSTGPTQLDDGNGGQACEASTGAEREG